MNKMPHAPLLRKVLFITVSLLPPAMVMPVPVGPSAALPALGVFGLLLFSNTLFITTQHE